MKMTNIIYSVTNFDFVSTSDRLFPGAELRRRIKSLSSTFCIHYEITGNHYFNKKLSNERFIEIRRKRRRRIVTEF